MPARRVAIVGGGFSGAMAAVNLARFGGPLATIIERAGVFGPGVAFGGRDRGQVLNVRTGNMSAYPDDPGHFERWLAARIPAGQLRRSAGARRSTGCGRTPSRSGSVSMRANASGSCGICAPSGMSTATGWRLISPSGSAR